MTTCHLDLLGKRKKSCGPLKLHENPVMKGLRNISEKARSGHRSCNSNPMTNCVRLEGSE